MKTKNFIQLLIFSALAAVFSACVPKATEKKAVCGTNQSFNSITRACVSITEPRYKPTATLTSQSLTQETSKTITLSYTDGNSDKATSCRLTSISTNIEAVSPQVTSGAIFTIADSIVSVGSNMAGNIPNPGDSFTASGHVTSMQTALNIARTSFNHTNMLTQLSVFEAHLTSLNTIASGYIASYPLVKSYYDSVALSIIDYNKSKTFVTNRCDCAGGVCTTIIAPKKGASGTGGFTYSITDADGEGTSSVVNLSLSALSRSTSFLAPSVTSTYVSGNESATNTPSAIAFSLGSAADYYSTASFTYSHGKTVASAYFANFTATKTYVNSDSGLGKITNCLGLGGSATTDILCDYVPNDGDAYSSTTPAKATANISGLVFEAKAEGSNGNNISIVYKDINTNIASLDGNLSTSEEKFGLAAGTNDVYIRVIGDTIYVVAHNGLTTNAEIKDAINNDPVASKLVTITAWNATAVNIADAATGVSLAGGVTGYDTFSYTVSNGSASSANSAKATIQVVAANDYPYWKRTPSSTSPLVAYDGTATSYTEGSAAITFSVPLSTVANDVDNVVNTCTISTSSLDLALSPDLTGVTVAEIDKAYMDFVFTLPVPHPTCSISTVAGVKYVDFSIDRSHVTKTNAYGDYALLFKVGNGAALTTNNPTFHAYRFKITAVNDRPDMTAISWSTSSTNPVTSSTGTTWTMATVRENSTASPSSSYAIITVNPDVTATGYESSQTLTMTAASSNQTILKDSNITVTDVDATHKRIDFVTEPNQSSVTSFTITLTLKDNGGTSSGGVDTHTAAITVTVNMVDDPPYFVLPSSVGAIETNEGGMVQSMAFNVQEDQGLSPDEDAQSITITEINSDNNAVIPSSNITVFYDLNDNGVEDTGEARDVGAVGVGDILESAAADDSGLHSFYLKLKPIAGISGNANITVKVSDGTSTETKSFSLIVHSVAALHGGWANLSAVGIKTDKNGAPVSTADMQCNYNKTSDPYKCMNGSTAVDCTRSGAPHGLITPTAANIIFYDSANKKCYRSTSTSMFSWVDLSTSCPVTRINLSSTSLTAAITSGVTASIPVGSTSGYPAAGVITIESEQIAYTGKTATTFTGLTRGYNSTTAAAHANAATVSYTDNGKNFIKDTSLTPAVNTPTATAKSQYYYDAVLKTCYESREVSSGVWGWNASTFSPSKVTLTWNAFTISTSGADATITQTGWNVYRRVAGEDYDYVNGYLRNPDTSITGMTINNSNTRTFTDTTAVAGKVYYYLVRPVDSAGRTISTPDVFSEVRILAPVENYSFVHRWIVNQEVCNSMHMTTSTTNKVDPTRNYRCPYKGPGESQTSPGYYDIGQDMLVDISESGCPYTAAPACNTGNGCIGIGDPSAVASGANTNDIYYDRSTGMCHRYNGAAWEDYNSATLNATIVAKTNTALNPPLTNVTMAKAAAICQARSTATPLASLGIANGASANPVAAPLLPTKKEFIAYSAAPYGATDSVITDLEQGYSLNVQSRCNSSSANGIDSAFTDSTIPSTSYIFSLPGTASSSIRSIYTGSIPFGINYSTELCSSRYGIQDIYGNVAEWVKDSASCSSAPTLTTQLNGAINNVVATITVDSTAGFEHFSTIVIDSEQMNYVVASATTLTVVRGSNSTAAAAHADNAVVSIYAPSVCKTVAGASGTDLGRYDFLTGLYSNTPTIPYGFDLVTGPYNDQNADSKAGDGDGFLTEWDFRDELFAAGKFSFPVGMPVNVDIGSSAVSANTALNFLLDIGPTSGLTTSQLHEDGIILNAADVNNVTSNPTQTGSFAQGGSWLSSNRAGRYSSELVPDADLRSDIGFRCYIPIDKTNYPPDAGRHTYSY